MSEASVYAGIHKYVNAVSLMKRITVFADEEVFRKLRDIAERENRSISEVARKALVAYVSRRQPRRTRLSLVAIGKSGRKDVAARSEELLRKGFGNAADPR